MQLVRFFSDFPLYSISRLFIYERSVKYSMIHLREVSHQYQWLVTGVFFHISKVRLLRTYFCLENLFYSSQKIKQICSKMIFFTCIEKYLCSINKIGFPLNRRMESLLIFTIKPMKSATRISKSKRIINNRVSTLYYYWYGMMIYNIKIKLIQDCTA